MDRGPADAGAGKHRMTDVVIAGGGVIGLSIAWELAGQGVDVTLLEQSSPGREASWAGAGILPPGRLSHASGAESSLRALSHSLWPEWSRLLQTQTSIDNGYVQSGGLSLSFDGRLDDEIDFWEQEGIAVERLTSEERHRQEPAVNDAIVDCVHNPEVSQVRNPRHLKALHQACLDSGVQILEGTPVLDWDTEQDRTVAAITTDGRVAGGRFVIAAGAWSSRLLSRAGFPIQVTPVRGQIALLKCHPLPFRHVLEVGPRYLVPRPDGRIVVGSTEERVGFVKQNTVEGIQGLLDFARSVVPSLADAELERCWSGLRPSPLGAHPAIGRLPGSQNVYVATGHFRSGLQQSCGTARLMRQLLLGQAPSIDASPFEPVEASTEAQTGSVIQS